MGKMGKMGVSGREEGKRRGCRIARMAPVILALLSALVATAGAAKSKSGMDLIREGRIGEALVAFEKQARASGSAYDFYNLALAHSQQGNLESIAAPLQEALSRLPTFADAWINMGVYHQATGNPPMSVECYRVASRLDVGSKSALAFFNMGSIHLRSGDTSSAHSSFASAVRRDAELAVAIDGLGSVYSRLGDAKTAQAMFRRALTLDPKMAESHFNLATVERQRGNWNLAIESLGRAASSIARGSSDPTLFWSQVYNNYGGALHAVSRYDEAIQKFDKAIELAPGSVMAYVNKGETRRVQGLWDDAIACTRIASILDPGHGVALSNLIMYKQNVCDWRGIAGHFASLTSLLAENDMTHTSSGEDPTPTVSPYQAVTFPFSPAHTLSLLNAYAQDILSKVERIRPLVRLTPPPQVSGDSKHRLRIAYMSSDFGQHTTGENVAGIFRHHNRKRFHVFAYALSPSDGSKTRTAIESTAETFREFSDLSTVQLAFAVNADGIHILVDMNGHTLGARSHVTALRPAPITIFDQGFAGSSGGIATHFNADRTSLPPEYAKFHSERITYMPYFSNPLNNHREASSDIANQAKDYKGKRREIGLPGEETFLFGCFNTAYKYDASILDDWTSILEGSPDSALWLMRWPGTEKHIWRETQARGWSNSSLIMTDVFPKESHMQWKSIAQLFLDTTAFNGHGTLSQMLWMAVPTLTRPLERIGQRIGASVVLASAAPELVAQTREEYVALAKILGGTRRGRKALERAHQRLQEDRLKSRLFDIKRYVLDYERVTAAVWDSFAHTIDFSERDGGDEAHDTGRHWKLGNVVASRDRM